MYVLRTFAVVGSERQRGQPQSGGVLVLNAFHPLRGARRILGDEPDEPQLGVRPQGVRNVLHAWGGRFGDRLLRHDRLDHHPDAEELADLVGERRHGNYELLIAHARDLRKLLISLLPGDHFGVVRVFLLDLRQILLNRFQ